MPSSCANSAVFQLFIRYSYTTLLYLPLLTCLQLLPTYLMHMSLLFLSISNNIPGHVSSCAVGCPGGVSAYLLVLLLYSVDSYVWSTPALLAIPLQKLRHGGGSERYTCSTWFLNALWATLNIVSLVVLWAEILHVVALHARRLDDDIL